MSGDLEFTGERFIPGAKGEIWVEHWHRYHFASRWAAGKSVLDVACGEGYGSALLSLHAARVSGVDLSPEAIAHAKATYAALANTEFAVAPCTALPFGDASFDLAVSFETVEHIAEQEAFLAELARVLKPEGLLILSCPNRREYSDRRGFRNAFHVKELYREELSRLVGGRFPGMAWYGQRPSFFSLIAPESAGEARGELFEVEEGHPQEASARLADPLYFVVVASRSRDAIAALTPTVSVLADHGDWIHRDYEKVMRELHEVVARGEALEAQVAARDGSIAALQGDQRKLQEALRDRDAALSSRDTRLGDSARELAAKDAEILRRRGWSWWLRLPLVRLGLLRDDASR